MTDKKQSATVDKSPAEITTEKRLAHRLYCIAHGYKDTDVDWIGTQLEDDLLKCVNEFLTSDKKYKEKQEKTKLAEKIVKRLNEFNLSILATTKGYTSKFLEHPQIIKVIDEILANSHKGR